ncbi:MAG: head-tail adaptor protein [Afipia sp.]|nr:head-tail adaptor protein [Afipia sp.]
MTQAGDLREEIELSRDINTPDGGGGYTTTHEVVLTAPARIKVLKAGETIMAGRLASTQTLVVTIRNQPALADAATTWQLRNTRTNKTYDIKSITPDERSAFVDILCETGVI